MSQYGATNEDLKKAEDQYCSVCKTKKTKYLGTIFSARSVMFKPNCYCADSYRTSSSTDADKKMFEHISTPIWVHAGLKPNAKDKAQLKYMKDHGMSFGDLRRQREAGLERRNDAMKALQHHESKYGRGNAPDVKFNKESN